MINKYSIKLIIFFSLVIYIGCHKTGQGPLPPYPKVTLSASPTNVAIAETFILDVNVANIEHLFAISFQISFNPSILEIAMETGSINYNTFTNENFGPVVLLDTFGVLSVALGGNDINGKIFSVTIQGKISGTTDIELKEINLIKEDGTNVSNINSLISSGVVITVN